MSHNEKRGHWTKEGLISSATGMLFGASYVAMSHPFDTIQTKMQAQKGFEGSNLFGTIVKVMKSDGIKGFYRGVVPPLWGSGIYRSVQFSAFEATYTFLENDFGKKQIPFTKGLETRVIFGGLMSGTFRALIETPLEYAKIQRQMGKSYTLRECYTGLKITWIRSCTLMPTYFIFLDSFRRNFDNFFRTNALGPFIISGISGVFGWWVCWPLELMKCQIQAGYLKERNLTIIQRMKYVINERGGFFGLYRGLAAGTCKCFIGNGFGMVVLVYAQKKITEWGLRGEK